MSVEKPVRDQSLSENPPLTPDFRSFPEIEIVRAQMTRAVGSAAISAHKNIQLFTKGMPETEDLPKEEKKRREKIIDTDADTAFKIDLSEAPIEFWGIDAEGAKEAHEDKLGEAMPLAVGKFGNGSTRAAFVADVVENTTAATHGRPNSISIAGISTFNGITKIPKLPNSGEDANYFRKLFAPAEFKDILSLEQSTRANLIAMMRISNIQAKDITCAIMDRPCNATVIREAEQLGAKVELISQGDLLWGLRAMLSDPLHPIVMLGRGGAPEGSITAIAARALRATGQIRVIEDERNIDGIVDTSKIWTADEFIQGAPEHSMVIFSAITQNTHFGLDAVNPVDGKPALYLVENIVVDSSGFHKEETTIRYPLSISA